MGLSQMFSLVILVSFLHLTISKVRYILYFLTILTAAAASCESIRGVKLHSLHYSQTGRHCLRLADTFPYFKRAVTCLSQCNESSIMYSETGRNMFLIYGMLFCVCQKVNNKTRSKIEPCVLVVKLLY